MSNQIDFYFDIISPYSYIAHKRIQQIKEIKFNYRPILLGGLHNLVGINAPTFNKYKMKNMKNDCELVAKKNNIHFTWNLKFQINSLHLMREFLHIEENQKEIYLDAFFDGYWKDNLDLSNDKEIVKLLKIFHIDSKKILMESKIN